MVSASSDFGLHFAHSEPIKVPGAQLGPVGQVDAELHEGVLHLAWNVLGNHAEVFYTQSTGALHELMPPVTISNPNDGMSAASPTVAVDGDERVFVAWRDRCNSISATCTIPMLGIYMRASSDSGASFEAARQIADQTVWSARLLWVDDGLRAAWTTENQLLLLSDSSAFGVWTDLTQTGGQQWPFQAEEMAGGDVVLSWTEGPGIGQQTFFFAHLEQWSAAPPLVRELAREPADQAEITDLFTQVGVGNAGDLLWLTASEDFVEKEAVRTIRFSEDRGATFGPPQPLEFMLPPFATFAPRDYTPLVGLGQNRTAYVAWTRTASEPNTQGVMFVRGEPVADCPALAEDP